MRQAYWWLARSARRPGRNAARAIPGGRGGPWAGPNCAGEE